MITGEELKERRKRAGLTQQQLGELLGYKGRSAELVVQHWEHGRQPIPLAKMKMLSKILRISLDELIP